LTLALHGGALTTFPCKLRPQFFFSVLEGALGVNPLATRMGVTTVLVLIGYDAYLHPEKTKTKLAPMQSEELKSSPV